MHDGKSTNSTEIRVVVCVISLVGFLERSIFRSVWLYLVQKPYRGKSWWTMAVVDRQKGEQTLSDKLAQRILRYIDDDEILPGEHLGEASLAAHLQVSRTPVRAALKALAEMGVVESHPNRGFFLRSDAPDRLLSPIVDDGDATYFQIGEDRLSGLLPDRMTESEFLRRYSLTRTQLGRLLRRMTLEGWVERLPGKGWGFLPVLNTEDGYIQMYQFRAVVEPAALLLPGYSLGAELSGKLRRQQTALLGGKAGRFSRAELFEIGAYFHEAIVSGARNDLMTEAIRRANQLRRLMDYRYRAQVNPARIVDESGEHLHLLDMVDHGDLIQASEFLREHLESALRRKSGLTTTGVASPA